MSDVKTTPRGVCPTCRLRQKLTEDGRLAAHPYPDTPAAGYLPYDSCPGAGYLPRVWQ